MISILLATLFYFMPTGIALIREHRNAVPIFLSNLFFGWTGIGCLFVFIWSFTK